MKQREERIKELTGCGSRENRRSDLRAMVRREQQEQRKQESRKEVEAKTTGQKPAYIRESASKP
jgi:hypothetical protein